MHNPQDDAQIRPSLFATAHATALALLCVQRFMCAQAMQSSSDPHMHNCPSLQALAMSSTMHDKLWLTIASTSHLYQMRHGTRKLNSTKALPVKLLCARQSHYCTSDTASGAETHCTSHQDQEGDTGDKPVAATTA
eukprot:18305-Heterococcus_DN1.PRE.3